MHDLIIRFQDLFFIIVNTYTSVNEYKQWTVEKLEKEILQILDRILKKEHLSLCEKY